MRTGNMIRAFAALAAVAIAILGGTVRTPIWPP
jgi:hypothetical protein